MVRRLHPFGGLMAVRPSRHIDDAFNDGPLAYDLPRRIGNTPVYYGDSAAGSRSAGPAPHRQNHSSIERLNSSACRWLYTSNNNEALLFMTVRLFARQDTDVKRPYYWWLYVGGARNRHRAEAGAKN